MDAVIYRGPSMFDGNPIIVVATGFDNPTKNDKTGQMVQLFIMREDVPPHDAVRLGQDISVCGTCPMASGGICYVVVYQAPLAVWKRYHRGGYQDLTNNSTAVRKLMKRKQVRIGAYGDPAAVPTGLWSNIVDVADVALSYTHSWRTADPALAEFSMASVDSVSEYVEARAKGWRTFRTRMPWEPLLKDEVQCPHRDTGLKCIDCRHCDGNQRGLKGCVSEVLHGQKAKRVINAIKEAA